MIDCPLWVRRLQQAWKQVPVVWLTGVRRVGKTVLAQNPQTVTRYSRKTGGLEVEFLPVAELRLACAT